MQVCQNWCEFSTVLKLDYFDGGYFLMKIVQDAGSEWIRKSFKTLVLKE